MYYVLCTMYIIFRLKQGCFSNIFNHWNLDQQNLQQTFEDMFSDVHKLCVCVSQNLDTLPNTSTTIKLHNFFQSTSTRCTISVHGWNFISFELTGVRSLKFWPIKFHQDTLPKINSIAAPETQWGWLKNDPFLFEVVFSFLPGAM